MWQGFDSRELQGQPHTQKQTVKLAPTAPLPLHFQVFIYKIKNYFHKIEVSLTLITAFKITDFYS